MLHQAQLLFQKEIGPINCWHQPLWPIIHQCPAESSCYYASGWIILMSSKGSTKRPYTNCQVECVRAFYFPLPYDSGSQISFIMHTTYQLAASPHLASVPVSAFRAADQKKQR